MRLFIVENWKIAPPLSVIRVRLKNVFLRRHGSETAYQWSISKAPLATVCQE